MTNEELVTRIKAGEDVSDNMARLYEQTHSFIHSMAWRYRGYAELDDLEQEGYLALYDAISGYDPAAGCLFLTYARHWIRQHMIRFVQDNGTVRIPAHEWERLRQYHQLRKDFQLLAGREPTEDEISRFMGLSLKQVRLLKQNAGMGHIQSLDAQLNEEEDTTIGETVAGAADVEGAALDEVEAEQLRERIWGTVDSLPGRQPAVIRARYQEEKSLKEAGQRIGVSPEMVRQIENKALRELRKPSRSRALRPFLPDAIGSRAYMGSGSREFERTWTSSTERTAIRL